MFCLFLIFFAVAIASPFPYSSDSTIPDSVSDDFNNPENVGLSRIPASSPDNIDVIASDVTPVSDYSPNNPDYVEESSVPANPQSNNCITGASTNDNVDLELYRRGGTISCPASQIDIPVPNTAPALNVPANSEKTKDSDDACKDFDEKPRHVTCGGPEFGRGKSYVFQVLNCEQGKFFNLP